MLREEWVNPEELEAVLHELHADELQERLHHDPIVEDDLHPDDVTVAAISEVTGATPETVMRILQEIRRDRREEDLAHRLAKLEEPLYRVERPSPDYATRPSNLNDAFARRHTVNSTLSDLERREVKRIKNKLRTRNSKPTSTQSELEEEKARRLAIILYILLAVIPFALYILQSSSGR